MTPSREELLFGLALTKPADERETWLDRECGNDRSLRLRLAVRLAAREHLSPADQNSTQPISNQPYSADEGEGAVIGRCKLLEKLGEGGFGAVWLAEQKEPVRRKVAERWRQKLAQFEQSAKDKAGANTVGNQSP